MVIGIQVNVRGVRRMKIGIPRALLYYYYVPFWKKFFEELKMEVIISEETNKVIVDKGVKESVPEICVPIKLFVGHAIQLLKQNVDYIFVPRMVSITKGEYFCPKFMGLPDMMKHGLEKMEDKILTCYIQSNSDDISDYKNYLSLAKSLGVNEEQIQNAAKVASEEWLTFRMYNKLGYTVPKAIELTKNTYTVKPAKEYKSKSSLRIGLLGYVYNIYDPFINMDVIEKLRELQVEFITFDMMDEQTLVESIEQMEKVLFWTFSNKVLGAGYHLFNRSDLDGIIQITAFGCGPDSFLSKLFEIKSDETGIPFMMVRVDEHTGENHLQTRIEAFVDMLKRKKQVG